MTELPEESEKTPAELISRLTERDVRILGLVALGWSNSKIARLLHFTPQTVNTRMSEIRRKLGLAGRGRGALVLFYVNHILPTDMQGVPLDKSKSRYTEPGEKLREWRARAEQIRADSQGLLKPRIIEAAMLLANPEYVDLNDEALGALMSGETPITGESYHGYIRSLTLQLNDGSKHKLAVIVTLAPFNVSDDEKR